MKNVSAAIHNRISTLCQAYVKKNLPEIWEKLRQKAQAEYKNRQYRRTTDLDLENALQTELVEAPRRIPVDSEQYREWEKRGV